MKAYVTIDDDGHLMLRCSPETEQETELLKAFLNRSDIKAWERGIGNKDGFMLEGIDFGLTCCAR